MKRKEDLNLSSQVGEEESSDDDLIAELQNSGMPTKRLVFHPILIET